MNSSQTQVMLAYKFFERFPQKLNMNFYISNNAVEYKHSISLYSEDTVGCIFGAVLTLNGYSKIWMHDHFTYIDSLYNGNRVVYNIIRTLLPEVDCETINQLDSHHHWPEDIRALYETDRLTALRLALLHFIPELGGHI